MMRRATEFIERLGDWSLFSLRAIRGCFSGTLRGRDVVPIFFAIGVKSVGVVAITGLFIGMVLALQAYGQFHTYNLDTSIGAVANQTILSELGPVLAAVMLAGRVGSAMAAELATMRVSEQLDALSCLGVDPVHYLVTPRFLACMFLIPLLTVIADVSGIVGSVLVCNVAYDVDSFHYWNQTMKFVGLWAVGSGLVKALVFGAVLSLICCHRGFTSGGGAAGVGQASTDAFVSSFVAILILDFFLVYLLNTLKQLLHSGTFA